MIYNWFCKLSLVLLFVVIRKSFVFSKVHFRYTKNLNISVENAENLQIGNNNVLVVVRGIEEDVHKTNDKLSIVSEVSLCSGDDEELKYSVNGPTCISFGNNCTIAEVHLNTEFVNDLKNSKFTVTTGDNLVSVTWYNYLPQSEQVEANRKSVKIVFSGDQNITHLEKKVFEKLADCKDRGLVILITDLLNLLKARLKHINMGCIELEFDLESDISNAILQDKHEQIKDLFRRTIIPGGAMFDVELQSPPLMATESLPTSESLEYKKQDNVMTDEKNLVQESNSDCSPVIAGDVENKKEEITDLLRRTIISEGEIFDVELQSQPLTATKSLPSLESLEYKKQDEVMTDVKDMDCSPVITDDNKIMEVDEEYNQFLQDLQQYPNYFQMGTQNCSSNFWRKISQKIKEEKEELLEFSDLVRIKNQNLEACASYNLGDVGKAEQIISKVLEETNSTSINACAMMAILRYQKGEITKAKRHLSHIKELAADPYNIDVAKSELAYAYTRLDATFYKKAITLYAEAVERNPNNIPWKFGLAVIYRRCLNTSIQSMFPDLQLETCFNEAKKHLTYVLKNCTDEKDNCFKARSYIELADLYSTAKTTHIIFTEKHDKQKIIDLVNQGVQCLPQNTTILRKAGRILRHCFQFDKAEELLQKAYDICPNSYICHQLGLIQKRRIIYQHRQLQEYLKRNQRYGPDKWYQASGSWRDPSDNSIFAPHQTPKLSVPINVSKQALTEPKPLLKHGEETKNPADDNDLEARVRETLSYSCTIGSPDPFYPKPWIEFDKGVQEDDLDPAENPNKDHQLLAVTASDDPSKATGGPTIILAETLSKMSLTIPETGKELVKATQSLTPPSVSSWPTSTIKKSGLQNNPVVKMKRLIKSPGIETFDLELSRKLEPCLDLFKQSAELGQEQNLGVYYDWGITLLQMIPTKFDEVMEKFNHILANDSSPFMRYRCYEQYGICKLRMSESQDFDELSREDYREDAKEMFRKAIRCWAYCQKLNLSKHIDDVERNCQSFKSIREIILGEDLGHGIKPQKGIASLCYLVKQYGSSLSLYQEVYDELQRTSNTAMDSDIIRGIINNHLQLQQYTGVLDLLALLMCSKEGLQCLEFKTDVLTQMLHYSIDKHDYQLSESVFNFEKDPHEEFDDDVVIIFNEKDQLTKTKGATLQKWLGTFSKSVLKVIQITETVENLPRLHEQVKLICNSKMAIFILANETPSTELTYLMNTALKARLNNTYFLKTIFPIVINDGMVPDIFNSFRSMRITHQLNTAEDQDKSEFLKTFSEIFLS